MKQYGMKQRDKLSGYEGFESVVFEAHGSYCCISPSNWCSLSSLNFVPFVVQSMLPIPFSSASLHIVHVKQVAACSWKLTGASSYKHRRGSQGIFSLRWEVYRDSHTCWFFPYFPQSITSFFSAVLLRSHKSDDI